MEDQNIRLRLQAFTEGTATVQEQLRAILSIEQLLTEEAQRQRAESARRSKARKNENEREKGLLESLQAKYRELGQARDRATSVQQIRQYNRELAQTQRQMDALTGSTQRQANQMRSMQGLIAGVFTGYLVQSFGREVLKATTNMQDFGITLTALLGSKEKSDLIAAQAVELAKRTPFTLQDVQEQIVKLSAYNVATEELIPTIEALGNIAAGVGKEKLPFLTLAYGQVRAANRLTGQELRQFTEAGVPLLELLQKTTGKTGDQIRKDMANGVIGFAEVKVAIESASAAGGKFANLMEARSKSISGQISNLSDSVFQGMNRVGKVFTDSGVSAIEWGRNAVNALLGSDSAVQRTGQYVKAAVVAWLTYRAAMVANSAATLAANASFNGMRVTVLGTTYAVRGLSAALVSNPIGLIALAVGTAFTAFQAWKASTVEVTSALGEQEVKLRSEKEALNALGKQVLDTSLSEKTRLEGLKRLQQQFPDYFKGIDGIAGKEGELKKAIDAANSSYTSRIGLARAAYQLEQNEGKRRSIFEQDAAKLQELKDLFPALKIQSYDLAGGLDEVRKQIGKLSGESGSAGLLTEQQAARLALREFEARSKRIAEQQKEISDADTKVLADKEKFEKQLGKTSKTQLATENTGNEKRKQWHNEDLLRGLNLAKMREQGLQRELAILDAEERIALDKATFEKKSVAEREGIVIDFEEKREKAIRDDHEATIKNLSEVQQTFEEFQKKALETRRKSLEDQRKLDEEFVGLERERLAVRAEAELAFEKSVRLSGAGSSQERERIEAEFAKRQSELEQRTLTDRIFRIQAEINAGHTRNELIKQGVKGVSEYTIEQERQARNEIVKLETQVLKAKKEATDLQIKTEEEKVKRIEELNRRMLSDLISLFSNMEGNTGKALAGVLTAYQQFKDKGTEATIADKLTAGFTAASAAASYFFAESAARYNELAEQAVRRNKDEMRSLEERQAADLEGFVGTEAQKAQVEREQQAEKEKLQEQQRAEEAALKLKAWKSEQAAKATQTAMSGALAGIQAFATAGNPIAGAIFAALIAGATLKAIADIMNQKPPEFFAKGSEFVDREGRYQRGRDSVPAYLTPGESVLTVTQNDRKRRAGYTNATLIDLAERLPAHVFALEGRQAAPAIDLRRMEGLLASVDRKLGALDIHTTETVFDEHGMRKREKRQRAIRQAVNRLDYGRRG
jgi:tape measure domain-containing protein